MCHAKTSSKDNGDDNACWKKIRCYGLLITQGETRSRRKKQRSSWKLGLLTMEANAQTWKLEDSDGWISITKAADQRWKGSYQDTDHKDKGCQVQRSEVNTRS